MARKKKSDGGGGGSGDWLNTYADMVTLLLTFFIMLFSMSSVDAEKWQMLLEAFTDAGDETAQVVLVPLGKGSEMGTNKSDEPAASEDSIASDNALPADFNELFEYIQQYVNQNNLQGQVELQRNDNSVFIRFNDNIFFDGDSATLRISSYELLNFLGDCFKSVEDQILAIRINGHTAAIPGVENYQVNDRILSSDRANAVAIYFEETKNIAGQKAIAIGYGKNYPVADNDTEEGRAKNRRVDMMILSDSLDATTEEELYNILQGSFDIAQMEEFADADNGEDILIPPETSGTEIAPETSGTEIVPQP